MKCEHDLAERETACADGMCPLCLAARLAEAEGDAALGRIAIKFVDRAGDVCEVDPADRICREFHAAMSAEVERQFRARMQRDADSAEPVVHAQHSETGRVWSGPAGAVPTGYVVMCTDAEYAAQVAAADQPGASK